MDGRAIEVTAAASAALGVVAVVTGESWAAVGAGLTAVVAAGLVLRRTGTADTGRDDEAAAPAARPRFLPAEMVDATLEDRIASARRALRPVSLVLFDLTTGAGEDLRRLDRETVMRSAEVTLREADVVGHDADGTFVLILEDTGEDGAVWTAERFRRHVLESMSAVRFVAGVATYPNHGLDAGAVHDKARVALAGAREWGRDRIEVASAT